MQGQSMDLMSYVSMNRLNAQEIFDLEKLQHLEGIFFSDTVPAGGTKPTQIAIGSSGHFQSQYIFLSYTTAETVGGVSADTGIDYLRGKFSDTSLSIAFFNDYIPFHLWAIPGRILSIAGSGTASNQAHWYFPWQHFFKAGAYIKMEVQNASVGQPNSWNMLWLGVRIMGQDQLN
jgi:hypothetical protein